MKRTRKPCPACLLPCLTLPRGHCPEVEPDRRDGRGGSGSQTAAQGSRRRQRQQKKNQHQEQKCKRNQVNKINTKEMRHTETGGFPGYLMSNVEVEPRSQSRLSQGSRKKIQQFRFRKKRQHSLLVPVISKKTGQHSVLVPVRSKKKGSIQSLPGVTEKKKHSVPVPGVRRKKIEQHSVLVPGVSEEKKNSIQSLCQVSRKKTKKQHSVLCQVWPVHWIQWPRKKPSTGSPCAIDDVARPLPWSSSRPRVWGPGDAGG